VVHQPTDLLPAAEVPDFDDSALPVASHLPPSGEAVTALMQDENWVRWKG